MPDKPASKAKAAAVLPASGGAPSQLPPAPAPAAAGEPGAFNEAEWAETQRRIIKKYMEENMADFVGGMVSKMTAQMGSDMQRTEVAQGQMQASLQEVSSHVNQVESRLQEMGTSIDRRFDELTRMMQYLFRAGPSTHDADSSAEQAAGSRSGARVARTRSRAHVWCSFLSRFTATT